MAQTTEQGALMSFNATPLGQARRLDHSTFLGKQQPQRNRSPDPPRLFHSNNTSHPPIPPSSDDDNQPALVRYARLKQRELASRPGGPRIINTPPNPERWAFKDTSVNVATAFHQAANSNTPDIIDMQTVPSNSWSSAPPVPRSTSVEYEKETQSTSLRNRLAPPPSRLNAAGRGTTTNKRPLTKTTTSTTLVPDSEAENEMDASGRGKSPFDQVVDAAKRALAPATFYLRQRSQEPEGGPPNGQNSSYEYSAEEREFRANVSVQPGRNPTHRKKRMSVDNKAYRPSPSDDEGSEEWSDDGKGRRRRRKKRNEPIGGPLTTLPVMAADKRKRRKTKGKGDEGEGDGSESEENENENMPSNSRASVSRSSLPPVSRGSVPPEQPSHIGDVTLDDAEQGLHSIPEVEVEDDEAELESPHAHPRESTPLPSHPISLSVGAFLGRLVYVSFKTCRNLLALFINILTGLFFVFGRIFGTIFDTILLRPLRILGLMRSPSDEDTPTTKPVGKYVLIAVALLAAWYAIQEPRNIPGIPLPSIFTGKSRKHEPVFVAPGDRPDSLAELVSRLQVVESTLSKLADDGASNHDDLLGRLKNLASHEDRERRRIMDSVDGKVRDGVEGAVQAVRRVEETMSNRFKDVERKVLNGGELGKLKKEIESLKAATTSSSGGKRSEEALRLWEERLGEIEGDVKEALELGKKVAAVSAPSTDTPFPWWTKLSPSKSSGIMIKSSDGRDITELIDQLVTSSVLTHVHRDVLSKPDYARYSAGARVIPNLTSPTLELLPPTLSGRFLAYVTGHGHALGRTPVTALHHEVQDGSCWPFKGSQGQLGVMLSAPVKVESVSVDHVPKEVAINVKSAPKDMEVWGLLEGKENLKKVREWREKKAEAGQQVEVEYPPTLPRQPEYIRLANFTYDLDDPSHVQNFPVDDEILDMDLDFGIVVLMVKSNWGRPDLTCLYRFRVHGTRLSNPGLDTSDNEPETVNA